MIPNVTVLHSEIRKLASWQGLHISRYYLLTTSFASMFYFFIHHYGLYCLYIFFFSLLAPFFMELVPKEATKNDKDNLLPTLKKEYAYNTLQRHCLLWTFWLCNLMLFIWHCRVTYQSTANETANHIPLFLLTSNLLCYLITSYYYQFKFHYQLNNNKW